jgi:hypothetical protein
MSHLTHEFYLRVLTTLNRAGVPFLVGGTFALTRYTGIARWTKDLDLFIHRDDWPFLYDTLSASGIDTHIAFPHWLGKAHDGDACVDLIYNGGNGVTFVDDAWFERAPEATVMGVPVRLVPPEEMIWSKAFVMERERYEGADVLHIIRGMHASLDWRHLIARFDAHGRVLLSHLILFGFVYPHEAAHVPAEVLVALWSGMQRERVPEDARPVCRGTLLSREQYLADVSTQGYLDARLPPHGHIPAADLAVWTAAIESSSAPPMAFSPITSEPADAESGRHIAAPRRDSGGGRRADLRRGATAPRRDRFATRASKCR